MGHLRLEKKYDKKKFVSGDLGPWNGLPLNFCSGIRKYQINVFDIRGHPIRKTLNTQANFSDFCPSPWGSLPGQDGMFGPRNGDWGPTSLAGPTSLHGLGGGEVKPPFKSRGEKMTYLRLSFYIKMF